MKIDNLSSCVVLMDKSRSLEQMIAQVRFSPVDQFKIDDFITEKSFPIVREGVLRYRKELFLIPPLQEDIAMDAQLSEMRMLGFKPEGLPELLALATTYPACWHPNGYIVAPSQLWDGLFDRPRAPALTGDDKSRRVDLSFIGPKRNMFAHHLILASRIDGKEGRVN